MVFGLLKAAVNSATGASGDRRNLSRVRESRATLVIGKTTYSLVDWNPTGFQIGFYDGTLQVGDKRRVRMALPHRDINYGFDLNCEVRHVDNMRRSLGGAFLDVDPATGQILKRIYSDRLR